MAPSSKNNLGLNQLITRVKRDLLAEQEHNQPPLFAIEEITLELNFVITGDIDSGFNIGVVTLGSEVGEERVQKITLKMTPLVSKEQLIETINKDPQRANKTIQASSDFLVRGERPKEPKAD